MLDLDQAVTVNFELHPNLSHKDLIVDLPLCRVLLQNEAHYPWMILVPRRLNISRMIDLERADQLQLMIELDLAQRVLWNSFSLTQLNVAAIGNKIPQLHLHVIGRRSIDPAWPNTVWDHKERQAYPLQEKEAMICQLRSAFEDIGVNHGFEVTGAD